MKKTSYDGNISMIILGSSRDRALCLRMMEEIERSGTGVLNWILHYGDREEAVDALIPVAQLKNGMTFGEARLRGH